MSVNRDHSGAPGAPAPVHKHPLNADSWNFPWAAVRRFPICAWLPPEMTAVARWLVWAYWYQGGRWAKQPRWHLRTGTCIDVTNPVSLVPFADAAWAFETNRRYANRHSLRLERGNPRYQLDGIGFAFLGDDPFAGVDLDGCVTPWFNRRGRRAPAR